MDSNNWRAAQGQVQMPGQVISGESVPAVGMDGVDWRNQLQQDSRQRIVNKIMETLKRHLPFSGQEGLQELKKIAVRFEEKIYTAANSQSDYLRKISLKMLTMETKSQNPMPSSLQSNATSTSQNPQDPASQTMQSQMQNQVQQLPIPVVSNQSQVRQLLSQNIQNNIPSTGVPNSAGLTQNNMSQGTMPNVPVQNPNMQNMSNVTSNAVGNQIGQGVTANMYANSQRQIQARQQQVLQQDSQPQSQNSQQYLYNQQMQQHLLKKNYGQGGVPQSIMQSQMQQQQQQQQQNLLQQNHLQSSQPSAMQSSLRQSSASSTLQNQQLSLQQSTQSMLQQQPQSVLRQQQQPQQPAVIHQQQSSIPQHPMLPTQQQQQLSSQQPNTNMQQNQMITQKNNILDSQHQQQQRIMAQQNSISNMQQQQTISQQNNLPNIHQQQSAGQQNNLSMHQQQSGSQTNISNFQQQQMAGIQHVNSSLQANQQSKVAVQQQMQQNMPQNMASMLPNQTQPSQSQPMQQQMMSQIQSQPGQLQQQLGLQQQANTLQQRIQTSGPMLQQQITIDQQKQMLQSQRVMPEVPLTSLDSSSQTGSAIAGDWQEEIYQKIKSMHEMYYPELNEMYQRMAAKLQQHDTIPQQPKNEQLEKLRFLKLMLERLIMFLRTNKNDIQPNYKQKSDGVEKQIINILNTNRPRKPVSSLQQGQLTQPHMHALQQSQQQQPSMSQMHSNDGQMNSQMQSMNMQGSMMAAQQNNLNSLPHNNLSSGPSATNSRQSILDGLQPGSNIDPGQGNALNQMQQVVMNPLQQNSVGGSQQMTSSISSQNGLTAMQSNLNSLQSNSNILQPQQIKQEQQMFTTQQLKQRQVQQQYLQRQHLMQQQQQQTSQQQSGQLPAQQMMQLNQMNDTNDIKMRQQMGGKPGVIQPHNSSGQRPSFHHQQLKSGTPFAMSSQGSLQAASPQIGHHSSPQIDQQNIMTSHTKAGTPMHSANSPFVVPSPSTSIAPSPMPNDSEKMTGLSAISNTGNSMHHPTSAVSMPNQSLAIGTPGISASPLLAEFTSPDGTHGVTSTIVSGNSNVAEQPLERLIKVVKSLSPKALSASVSDISSVVSMVDRIAGSAPGNGSRAAVGEDLVAMTKCRLQARNFFTQDGPSGTKKMRRYTSAMPCNVVSSTGSVNDSLRHLNGNESDGESTGASNMKRPRIEANHELEEELREINQRLIDTVVYISEDDVDPTAVAAATEGGEGTIVKCSFSAVALSPNLKSQYASAQMSPIQPLRLLIPSNYPSCSPILLDKFPVEVSKEYEDISIKAKSRFSISLRSLAQPMTLADIARTWDKCARAVISEYAQQSGGGTFSSKYGTWENCLSAA